MDEMLFLGKVRQIIESDSATVFRSIFEFYQELGNLSDKDLAAAFNAIMTLRDFTISYEGRKQLRSVLQAIRRIVDGKTITPGHVLWSLSTHETKKMIDSLDLIA